jgi:hypothetical protein
MVYDSQGRLGSQPLWLLAVLLVAIMDAVAWSWAN